jgi:hypothetical protein
MKYYCFLLCLITSSVYAQQNWWQKNNLRVIQTNLPDYEAATLNADSLVEDLQTYSANTLIINAGGIMAFYPSKLPFHYINPYMKPDMLRDVVAKCHQHNIKVIVRFDFSRVHESIFKVHPDWCYISPKGERTINRDLYVVSINAPYVQEKAFEIVGEVINNFPVDGIFLNMPGYQVRNPYENQYMGIDQNDYDKKRFREWSKQDSFPTVEDKANPLFRTYEEFKKNTVEDWSRRLHEMVKAKNPQIAICTYSDKYVDIIRHESQPNNNAPYWPYSAGDNVNNAVHSFPHHIISNASIQQINFQSRYVAVEPQEVAIRLYENMANGSGLDQSMMGDMRHYEDERNFSVFKRIYGFHKKHEAYFGNYSSTAKVALIAPGSWPSGAPMEEYRGIQAMLREAHIQFDIIEDAQVENLSATIKAYKVLLLPDITYLSAAAINLLKEAIANGTSIIATNTTMFDNGPALLDLFGAKVKNKDNNGTGNYLRPDNPKLFKRLSQQTMVSWRYNLGLYDFSAADSTFLPVLAKGRPGPPEIIGGHDATGDYAMALKHHASATAVLMPINIGRNYYLNGYQQHKNLFLDVLDHVYPQAAQDVVTNAPPRVEVTLQQYGKNNNADRAKRDGLILHLINGTGFSGTTYFDPIPVSNLTFRIRVPFQPSQVLIMTTQQPIPFVYKNGFISFTVKELKEFGSVLINK